MQTMQCVVKTAPGPGYLELVERPIPTPGPRDVLVRVRAAAICGTDVHIQDWADWAARRITPGIIIGHEFCGEVVEVGNDAGPIKVGNIISAETHLVCNHCAMCRNGQQHICYNTRSIGVHTDGCFAEYVVIPAENAFVCDPNLPVEVLSIMEPLGVAVHAALAVPVGAQTVAVVGCGPIGIMAVAVLRMLGASRIIALEPNSGRSKLAFRMGAHLVINPLKEEPVETVRAHTGGHGVDVVLEFSGSIPAITAALNYSKPGAVIVAAGLPTKPIDFNFGEFVYSGKTLKGVAGRLMYKTWEQLRGLLEAGLDVSPVITHVLPLDQYLEGLRLMKNGECGKAVLKIPDYASASACLKSL